MKSCLITSALSPSSIRSVPSSSNPISNSNPEAIGGALAHMSIFDISLFAPVCVNVWFDQTLFMKLTLNVLVLSSISSISQFDGKGKDNNNLTVFVKQLIYQSIAMSHIFERVLHCIFLFWVYVP